MAYPLEYITDGAYTIKRDVNRRAYLQSYFTALTADATDEVKAAMATALESLSAEPTTAEIDNLYKLMAADYVGQDSYWPSYSKTVTIGQKITDFSTVEDGQPVVFKIVNHNRYITINEDCNASMSANVTGLNVFRLHRVGETQTFNIESARKGYYFPELANSGWPTYTMQETDSPIAFEFLSSKADETQTQLGEGQFVVKSTSANAYFDGNATSFTGWQGKDANCVYEIYKVSPSEDKYYIGDFNFAVFDDLGNSYTGSTRGALGETPAFAGIAGCTFTNEEWTDNNANYTAKITFPFPISNENITNATTISSFKNVAENFLWYAADSDIKAQKNVEATSDNYLWAIYPAYNERNFTFTIKNVGTGKFIHSVSNANSHAAGAVTLGDEATSFTVEANNKFKLATGKYLSLNSSNDVNVQTLGTWHDHGGTYNKFPTSYPYHAVSATIGDAGYATLYAPVALTVPEGLVAYTGLYNSDKTMLTLTPLATDKAIPANTGVILKGTKGTYPFAKAESAEAIADNVLTGTASGIATSSVDGIVYTLQQDGENVVFKEYTGVALAAGKAYLVLDSESASAISLRFEGSTGIENSEFTIQNSEFIYDLMGRRVLNPIKGVYIVNGKKVVIK